MLNICPLPTEEHPWLLCAIIVMHFSHPTTSARRESSQLEREVSEINLAGAPARDVAHKYSIN